MGRTTHVLHVLQNWMRSPPCALHTSSHPFPPAPPFPSRGEGRERGGGWRAGASLLKTAWIQGGAESEGGRLGGGSGGGLCCCKVAQSVCQRQAHHKISQSVCQSVRRGVAHACASVFTTVSVLVNAWAVWLTSSRLSREKSNHTLIKCTTLVSVCTQYPWIWRWSGEKIVNEILVKWKYCSCKVNIFGFWTDRHWNYLIIYLFIFYIL